MSGHFPFWHRVVLLLSLLLIVAGVDFYLNRSKAAKYQEYVFLIAAGVLGSIFGFVNDIITSSISPEYFTLGKGLEEGQGLQIHAGLYGLQVGFSAGIIGGGICLYFSRRKSAHPPTRISLLFKLLWMPIACAILGGVIFPLTLANFDPAHFASQLAPILDGLRINQFREVWWIHIGLYAGMVAGLIGMIIAANKARGKNELGNSSSSP